jgi:hypothetical protein
MDLNGRTSWLLLRPVVPRYCGGERDGLERRLIPGRERLFLKFSSPI